MKGVVLCGGTGSRLRPITYSIAKQLVPVGNKPILFYGLEDLASAGLREVGLIVSPETAGEIRDAVGDGSAFGLKVEYIVQDQPLGLAHALKTALPFVDGDDVLMYLGDNLLKHGVNGVVDDFLRERPNCQILLARVEDPGAFGVVELDAAGAVVRLVEKPKDPPSDLALVGAYLFDATVAEAVGAIQPSARGELEITDAIQYMVDSGRTVRPSLVTGWWKDTGKKEDLLHANELVLEELTDDVRGQVVDSTIEGPIHVDEGARLIGCKVQGPVVIGRDAVLEGVTVGPSTSIGEGSVLTDAVVKESIVFSGVEIHDWRLRNSVIGRDSRLLGSGPAGECEMMLGERSEVRGG